MRKRLLIGVCVMATVVLGSASRADAKGLDDLWDILEPLSGPGPFTGGPVLAATLNCWEDGSPRFRTAMRNPDKLDPCLYLDFRDMAVEPKGPYARVTAKIVETGLSFEQHPALELGAGLGVAYFSTMVGAQKYDVTNVIVTPVRVVIKPLRLFPAFRANTRAGFIQLHIRGTVRFGDIDGSDFGAPASTFSAGNELLWGGGLVFDLLQAVRGR